MYCGVVQQHLKGWSLTSLFPKDEELAKRWSSQVKMTRADWTKDSKHSVICSNHFEADRFEQEPLLAAALGLETKRRRIAY